MNEISIVEINKILSLCDAYLLTEADIVRLLSLDIAEHVGEHYRAALFVLTQRARADLRVAAQLAQLHALARIDGVKLAREDVPAPVVSVPVYAGSL